MNENFEADFEGIVVGRSFGIDWLFRLYGVSDMKSYEVILSDEFCRRCKNLSHCVWRCISNDTCFEMTGFEERKEDEEGSEQKETF